MQAHEIRTWAVEEIEDRLSEEYRGLFNLRREWALGRLEDHNRMQMAKRDIARMKTILRERELSAELVGGGKSR